MNADVLIHPRATNAELFRITRAGYKVVKVSGKKWAARGVPVFRAKVTDKIRQTMATIWKPGGAA